MITKIYCEIDDFMKEFEDLYKQKLIGDDNKRSKLNSKLSQSEIMTIVILFHNYGNRTFKDFYTKSVCKQMRREFPDLVSYNRFVEIMQTVLVPLVAFLQLKKLVKSDEITFIDSTKIKVCNNKRIKANRTFKGLGEIGKSTMGWFFGFKLHITINEKGELVGANLSKGNIDDRDENVLNSILQNVTGKLYADKGYISKKLFENLYNKGIKLVTNVKKNMKNKLMPILDKLLLRKRSVIETVNDQLKNMCDIEHTRHRSPINAMVNLVAGLIRYTYFEKKPSINFTDKERTFLHEALDVLDFNAHNKGILAN
jgi:hypothetical protein